MACLTAAAQNTARRTNDFSLVGLAALARDAVTLVAVRESVVLYAQNIDTAPLFPPKYSWRVDLELAQFAQRFIDTFNSLFGDELPQPEPSQAKEYWDAYSENKILGRCVRIGFNPENSTDSNYHWAICRSVSGDFIVQEFWQPELWTTKRYRSALRNGKGPEL